MLFIMVKCMVKCLWNTFCGKACDNVCSFFADAWCPKKAGTGQDFGYILLWICGGWWRSHLPLDDTKKCTYLCRLRNISQYYFTFQWLSFQSTLQEDTPNCRGKREESGDSKKNLGSCGIHLVIAFVLLFLSKSCKMLCS